MTIRSSVLLQTHDISHLGYAVGHLDGRAAFAAYALPHEIVEVRLTREKRDYVVGATTRVLEANEARVEPSCPLFRADGCGGCQWQHANYGAQLEFKANIVRTQLQRIGGIAEPDVRQVLASPRPLGYRTHATFSVNDKGRLCFVAADERRLQPVQECLLIRHELQQLLTALQGVSFENVERVRLQAGSDPTDMAVVVYGTVRNIEQLRQAVPNVSIVQVAHARATVLQGRDWLTYQIAADTFRATAGGFFQVNLEQTSALVETVRNLLPTESHHALDLYSGAGLFTVLLARNSGHVTSIEEHGPSVRDARYNLRAFRNVTTRTGKVEAELSTVTEPVDVIVVDPPRAGIARPALDALIGLAPERVVYVSCEPTTLARDARLLLAAGYNLRSVQPIDMFPQTYHVETVAWFERS